jgi:hypothetical protein
MGVASAVARFRDVPRAGGDPIGPGPRVLGLPGTPCRIGARQEPEPAGASGTNRSPERVPVFEGRARSERRMHDRPDQKVFRGGMGSWRLNTW